MLEWGGVEIGNGLLRVLGVMLTTILLALACSSLAVATTPGGVGETPEPSASPRPSQGPTPMPGPAGAEAPCPSPSPSVLPTAPSRPETLGDVPEGTSLLGHSVQGRPIECMRLGSGPEVVLFMAAFHGDEPEGVPLLRTFHAWLLAHPALLEGKTVLMVPVVNPDGLARGTRTNAHDVDINRNFPARNWRRTAPIARNWCGPAPASEPETCIVRDLVKRAAPARIVSLHTPLGEVNYDGPAEELADAMALCNNYPTTPYIGYATPGSFGTWAGRERKIPTITLELLEGTDSAVWEENRDALVAALLFSGADTTAGTR